jgi:hypothetical protein
MEGHRSGLAHGEGQLRAMAGTLKVCPLCGAINARTNRECFVCRWAGQFVFNPKRVEEGLEALLKSCPELADAINELPPPRKPWWLRVLARWTVAGILERFRGRPIGRLHHW